MLNSDANGKTISISFYWLGQTKEMEERLFNILDDPNKILLRFLNNSFGNIVRRCCATILCHPWQPLSKKKNQVETEKCSGYFITFSR